MRAKRLFLGMVIGNVVGLAVIGLGFALGQLLSDPAVIVGLPSLLLIPFAIGLAAARVWAPLDHGIVETLRHSFACTLVGIVLSSLILREGAICLIILSPLLYCGVVAGALTGRVWFRNRRDRFSVVMGPFVLLAIAAEPSWRGPHQSVVTDEIRIAAPPAKVWPHVLAFQTIPERPNYWLFHLGLPYPTETTNGGNFAGANRVCNFSGGAVFREKVAEIEKDRLLTFDIVEAPRDPELIGHLDATRGQFELRDNGDGSTTLIGRTWYSLQVRPAWYFDWWTHDIFRAVHLRVMRNVQRLAETAP